MIEAVVVDKYDQAIELKIIQCFKTKLGAQKGINLPGTQLNLPALTKEDKKVLPFASKNADVIGYSFVRHENDVALLYQLLEELDAKNLGVVFKIENQKLKICQKSYLRVWKDRELG